MDYDTDALDEITLLGDVLAAVAHARTRLPSCVLDRILQVPTGEPAVQWPAPVRHLRLVPAA